MEVYNGGGFVPAAVSLGEWSSSEDTRADLPKRTLEKQNERMSPSQIDAAEGAPRGVGPGTRACPQRRVLEAQPMNWREIGVSRMDAGEPAGSAPAGADIGFLIFAIAMLMIGFCVLILTVLAVVYVCVQLAKPAGSD